MSVSNLTNCYTGWQYDPDEEMMLTHLQFLRESNTWSADRLREYQDQELRKVLDVAYRGCRYYRTLFDKIGFDPLDYAGTQDLLSIPLLSKEDIKLDSDAFIVDWADKDALYTITSGGSTGNPLKVYYDEVFSAKDRAQTYFYMEQQGHHPKQSRSIRMHGDPIDASLIENREYGYALNEKKFLLSSQHITPETLSYYVNAIETFEPEYIHAYPSAIYRLACVAEAAGYQFKVRMKCIYTDSEMLYPGQRKLIERVFDTKVVQTYGHTEGCMIAISVPDSEGMFLLPQAGFAEILDGNGSRVTEPGGTGELVVTGFNNHAFPLIRYRTMDIVTLGTEQGRYIHIDHVEGRKQDFAVDKKGGAVSVAPILFDYNIDWSGVQQFQIVQSVPGVLNVKICPIENSQDFKILEERLRAQLKSGFSDLFEIQIEFVPEIVSTSRGKSRYFVQNIEDTNTQQVKN
ncbi:phenylacetate--CoA ligase family protein [Pseudomonadota bacterium]